MTGFTTAGTAPTLSSSPIPFAPSGLKDAVSHPTTIFEREPEILNSLIAVIGSQAWTVRFVV